MRRVKSRDEATFIGFLATGWCWNGFPAAVLQLFAVCCYCCGTCSPSIVFVKVALFGCCFCVAVVRCCCGSTRLLAIAAAAVVVAGRFALLPCLVVCFCPSCCSSLLFLSRSSSFARCLLFFLRFALVFSCIPEYSCSVICFSMPHLLFCRFRFLISFFCSFCNVAVLDFCRLLFFACCRQFSSLADVPYPSTYQSFLNMLDIFNFGERYDGWGREGERSWVENGRRYVARGRERAGERERDTETGREGGREGEM